MLSLPAEDGGTTPWTPSKRDPVTPAAGGFSSRIAYAAAHVVAQPTSDSILDWETTLAFRHYLWDLGFGVAEAMDTAQRGSGLGWDTARELIRRTTAEAAGPAVYGATTDQLEEGGRFSVPQIGDAYLEQVSFIESHGGEAILMPSRHLTGAAQAPDDYLRVYDRVIGEASGPIMIHWLGEAFDPLLAGYWGSDQPREAADTVCEIVSTHAEKVSGVKLSVLDADLEVAIRRRLPEGVRMLTGDDLEFVDLILGDEMGHSDALLGVFDPIAPVAAAAFQALDRGDVDAFRALLEPALPLARHLFSEPTFHYKTGVVFLAYLNGFQDHFRMVAGAESGRSPTHLARLLVLADRAGIIKDPDQAAHRMKLVLERLG